MTASTILRLLVPHGYEAVAVAVLSDADAAPEDLPSGTVVDSLRALRPIPGETRSAHLERIRTDPTASLVALARNSLAIARGSQRDDFENTLYPERKFLLSSAPLSAEQIGTMMSQAITEVHEDR